MRFAEIEGNDSVKTALTGMVDSGRVPHAIMFHENDGGGAVGICLAFLQYLNCNSRGASDSCGACPTCNKISKLIHPDIHFVFPVAGGSIISASSKPTSLSYVKQWRELVLSNPYFTESDLNEALGIEGKSAIIAVPEARAILEKLSFNSLEGGYKAVVVYLPEKMNAEAANRLLKSIEEPPEKTLFLLITHAPEKVLITISSRCQSIRLTPLPRSRSAVGANIAEEQELVRNLLHALVSRDWLAALEGGENIAALPSRERMKSWCRTASDMLRTVFLIQQGMDRLVDVPSSDLSFYTEIATRLKKPFSRQAAGHIDRALMLIERNVNQKIVFCDLVNKLYIIA
mgnify:CR=1 FL=1